MQLAQLEEQFAIPGVLTFEQAASGLLAARITSPAAQATIYLQGAHITEWTPAGHKDVLFLSQRSDLAPGKPIRGGIPVIFPWFGPRHDGKHGPSHGFARTTEWQLAFAALSGQDVDLTFTLAPSEASRALGFDGFRVALRMIIGRALRLEFTVANDPTSRPLIFEEALHTYFSVADVTKATVTGLGSTAYIDKRDDMKRKVQSEGPMSVIATTDRVYLNTSATCTIQDTAGHRRITVAKSGSSSTVVWNPWAEVAATLPDMEPEGWRTMLCVETANVDVNSITLSPGETHTMALSVSVEELA